MSPIPLPPSPAPRTRVPPLPHAHAMDLHAPPLRRSAPLSTPPLPRNTSPRHQC
ncbi:MAG: hypothetical protein LBC18_10900 [Opitutaceae bacterium]|nr:hypothetical protein [Opitutaceae bacterium]